MHLNKIEYDTIQYDIIGCFIMTSDNLTSTSLPVSSLHFHSYLPSSRTCYSYSCPFLISSTPMCMLAGAAAIAEFKASPVSVRENYPGAENMLSDLSSKITAVSGVSPTLKFLLTFFLSFF